MMAEQPIRSCLPIANSMTSSSPASAETESATAPVPTPGPLPDVMPSLFQVWVAICLGLAAKLVAISGIFRSIDQAAEIPLLMRILVIGEGAATGVLAGIGLALLFKAIQLRRLDWLQPGHWIAVETLIIVLAELASFPWAGSPGFVIGISAFFMSQIVDTLVRGAGATAWYLAVVRTTKESTAWKVVAWTSVVHYGSTFFMLLLSRWAAHGSETGNYLMYGMYLISAVAVLVRWIAGLVAIILDWRQATPRNSLHWICLAIAVLTPIVSGMTFYLARMVH
jgi:hypothetical protein